MRAKLKKKVLQRTCRQKVKLTNDSSINVMLIEFQEGNNADPFDDQTIPRSCCYSYCWRCQGMKERTLRLELSGIIKNCVPEYQHQCREKVENIIKLFYPLKLLSLLCSIPRLPDRCQYRPTHKMKRKPRQEEQSLQRWVLWSSDGGWIIHKNKSLIN